MANMKKYACALCAVALLPGTNRNVLEKIVGEANVQKIESKIPVWGVTFYENYFGVYARKRDGTINRGLSIFLKWNEREKFLGVSAVKYSSFGNRPLCVTLKKFEKKIRIY